MRMRERMPESEGRRRDGQSLTQGEALLAEGPTPFKKVDAIVDNAPDDARIEMVCCCRLASHRLGASHRT